MWCLSICPRSGPASRPATSFGAVESVKAASDLYLPVGGEITAVNSVLIDSPEILNEDPYGEGWVVQIRVAPGIGALMSAEAYDEVCRRD